MKGKLTLPAGARENQKETKILALRKEARKQGRKQGIKKSK